MNLTKRGAADFSAGAPIFRFALRAHFSPLDDK